MADQPTSWGALPAEAEGPAAWGALPVGETGTKSTSASSYLPSAISDIPREMYQSTADALSGVKNAFLPKSLGGERDIGNEGTFGGLLKTGSGLLSAAQVPIAPLQGIWRSLAGHSLEAADKKMREHAASIYGEDKIRAVEKYLGNPEGGMTYEQAKEKADLALSGLGARGRGPVAAPTPPPGPNGPLGVTLSEGQLTRELPAIRAEQAAQRGQLGPDAERVAKAFNEQQAGEVSGAADTVAARIAGQNPRFDSVNDAAGSINADIGGAAARQANHASSPTSQQGPVNCVRLQARLPNKRLRPRKV